MLVNMTREVDLAQRKPTFQPPKGIKVSIFTRLRLINPTRVAKNGRIFLMIEIQRNERMEEIHLSR